VNASGRRLDGVSDPRFVVVMGVSGSGKTTLARRIARQLGWDLLEGDEVHPRANVEKMAAGVPLTDSDRRPWLDAIGAWMDDRAAAGTSGVVTCSALRRSYRDLLRENRPGVRFCHVTADPELLARRVEGRRGHYMPSSLLPSQLATLEPLAADEPGVTVSTGGSARATLADALRRLGLDGGEPVR
jgi:gluconokinase